MNVSTPSTYRIIRFFADPDKRNETRQPSLTLEEARAHCQRDDSEEAGVFFDGYTVNTFEQTKRLLKAARSRM
jgi:hypothetical protein